MEIVAEESKFFLKKLEENRTQTVFKSNEMEIDYCWLNELTPKLKVKIKENSIYQ